MDPTMAHTFELNFRVYQEILEVCRPFYALQSEGNGTDRYETSMEQNIPPRLEDGLEKQPSTKNENQQEHRFKGDRPITPRSTIDFDSE